MNLTTQQKTEIHNTIINNNNAPRVTNIDIHPAVGVSIPASVKFVPLPQSVIRIEPAWAGLAYFLFGSEIIIVDPKSHKIVAVLVA